MKSSTSLPSASRKYSATVSADRPTRSRTVNRPALFRVDRTIREVDRLAEYVEDPAERLRADRHRNRFAEIDGSHPALHSVGRLHRHRAHTIFAEVLLDLGDHIDVARF